MAEYTYKPLRTPEEIRLVNILPGDFDDPILLEINHVHLVPPPDDESRPKQPTLKELRATLPSGWTVHETYEGRVVFEKGLEASWTHPDPDYVSYDFSQYDIPGASPLAVRRNLVEALRYLRSSGTSRTMWIDAICINQNDIPEKNIQVPRMGSIYRLARRVVAWLGTEFVDCDMVFSRLEHLGKQVELTRDDWRLPSPDCFNRRLFRDDFPIYCEDEFWVAFSTMASRGWFQRAWTLQEIQLASVTSIMKCGTHEILWPLFRRAMLTLADKHNAPQAVRSVDTNVWKLCEYIAETFETLLWYNHQRLCHDSRDKIYAFTSLAPPYILESLQVNYAQDEIDVYRDVFLVCANKTQRLNLLRYCRAPDNHDADTDSRPTWVPNWSNPLRMSCPVDAGVCASSVSASRHEVLSSKELRVYGVAVATVSDINDRDCRSLGQVLQYLNVQSFAEMHRETYPSGGTLLDAWLYVLAVGMLDERMPDKSYPTITDLRTKLTSLASLLAAGSVETLPPQWTGWFDKWSSNSQFFRTKEGYIDRYSGDIIFVILGCDTPLLLRHVAKDRYIVIGDSYLHGAMDGEVLLGQLSDEYRINARSHFSHASEMVPSYIHKDTGLEQREDPRLEKMPLQRGWEPIEWEWSRDDPVHCCKFRNRDTGEVFNSDPRLFPEALRERGILIQQITLV
ncbi:heterokaryon incompatibility protein-domain-containing protein [Nemania abortiva]|nr:heterokaryon incompatibility protein-domain-containing protein [Nemania abortiva]